MSETTVPPAGTVRSFAPQVTVGPDGRLPSDTGLARLTSTRPVELALPTWPVYLLFMGFPLLWVLGLGSFAAILCAIPMLGLLWVRGTVSLPIGFAFWALFVVWACIAVIQIDDALRLVGYGVRMSNYVGATVVFLYVYNMSEKELPTRMGLIALTSFFAFVVLGGWLGVLLPHVQLTTPLSLVLPQSISSNDYVSALVRPNFAEIQHPYGSPTSFSRPSAPFPYTNGWGCNVALLVPCVAAAAMSLRQRGKTIVFLLVAASLVPAVATLNRGMYLAIGVGLTYAAVRLAMRGRLGPLGGLIVVAVFGVTFALLSGVAAQLQTRLEYSQSNVTRASIYGEAFQGAVQSPILGNGAPRPSQTLNISVGTQGQIWNVMFSYGFFALFFFLAWFAWVAFASRTWDADRDLWLHVCLVVAFMTIFFYGYDGMQLTVMMMVSALAVRRVRPKPAGADVRPGSGVAAT